MVSKQLLLKAIAGFTGVALLGLSNLSIAGGDFAPAPTPNPTPVVDESNSGFYAGVRGGYGNLDKGHTHLNNVTYDHDGFAGGVNVGYAFNKLFSVEAGYLYLPKTKFQVDYVNSATDFAHSSIRTRNNAFDISSKLTFAIPSMESIGVYGKVGIGFVNKNSKFAYNSSTYTAFNTIITAQGEERFKSTATTATYGAGVYWDATPSVRVEAGWQAWHSAGSKTPTINTATVGLSYFFGGDMFNS